MSVYVPLCDYCSRPIATPDEYREEVHYRGVAAGDTFLYRDVVVPFHRRCIVGLHQQLRLENADKRFGKVPMNA